MGPVPTRESMLAEAFVDLADSLVADFDVMDLTQRLVEDCVTLLNASAAGVLLIDQRGGMRVLASTSEKTRLLELFQVQVDRGPCVDCVRKGAPELVSDLEVDTAAVAAVRHRGAGAGLPLGACAPAAAADRDPGCAEPVPHRVGADGRP